MTRARLHNLDIIGFAENHGKVTRSTLVTQHISHEDAAEVSKAMRARSALQDTPNARAPSFSGN
jgi:hypothetical protein